MKIKICGLFREEDIDFANQALPDYAGFVLAPSRRQITVEQAIRFKKRLSPQIQTVGVFVNAAAEKVAACLAEGVIDIAQLHGDETEEDIQSIKSIVSKPVIKAVKVRSRSDVKAWMDSAADYLLFDSGAGSGKPFDWGLLGEIDRPFFLAGGLRPDNLVTAMDGVRPYAVDLSSGVETNGVKDEAKMRRAVELVRNYANFINDSDFAGRARGMESEK